MENWNDNCWNVFIDDEYFLSSFVKGGKLCVEFPTGRLSEEGQFNSTTVRERYKLNAD